MVKYSLVFYFILWNVSISHGESRFDRLKQVKTWMYQIQHLDHDGAVDKLAKTDYPLLVLEPGHNHKEYPWNTKKIVKELERTPNGKRRLLVAYIDIGQAEEWRTYWKKNWRAPTKGKKGYPEFIVTIDPDGWEECYPVAYWHKAWKKLWTGPKGIIPELAKMGFDGVYLDWVEAYDDEFVIKQAKKEKKNPELEMIQFIEEIKKSGERVSKGFLVIPQNSPYLLDVAPKRYAKTIDAIAFEDTWYHGAGDAGWDSPKAGDLKERHFGRWSTQNRIKQYKKYMKFGLPVFTVDYCIKKKNVLEVYRESRKHGFIPLVTRVSLSRMTPYAVEN